MEGAAVQVDCVDSRYGSFEDILATVDVQHS
jgi:hypothetical protein